MSSALSFNLQVTYSMYFLFYYMVNFIGFLSLVSTHVVEKNFISFLLLNDEGKKNAISQQKNLVKNLNESNFVCLFIAEQIANVIFVDFKLICFRYMQKVPT